jgi:hypothetical protein
VGERTILACLIGAIDVAFVGAFDSIILIAAILSFAGAIAGFAGWTQIAGETPPAPPRAVLNRCGCCVSCGSRTCC